MSDKKMILINKRKIRLLIALVSILYFTSYITRLNFNASIVEIIATTQITKEQAGIISTALFFSYGVGQLVSGYLGDRFNPSIIILGGLIATVICNVCMPNVNNVMAMAIIWGVNGLAQAMFWPPIVKILSKCLNSDIYAKACISVTVAAHIATIGIYLIVPICITFMNWQSVFYISAGFAALIALVWFFGYGYIEKDNEVTAPSDLRKRDAMQKNNTKLFPIFIGSGMITILLAIATQGYLKDGIITWLPTYLTETYNLPSAQSILSNIILPILSILGICLTTLIYKKWCKNEVLLSMILFIVAMLLTLLFIPIATSSLVLSVILASLITGCMHGINLMLISYVPLRFSESGKVSTVSGLTNSFTYIGSSISSYGLALIVNLIGWQYTIASWGVVCLIGSLLCLLSLKLWKKRME